MVLPTILAKYLKETTPYFSQKAFVMIKVDLSKEVLQELLVDLVEKVVQSKELMITLLIPLKN